MTVCVDPETHEVFDHFLGQIDSFSESPPALTDCDSQGNGNIILGEMNYPFLPGPEGYLWIIFILQFYQLHKTSKL